MALITFLFFAFLALVTYVKGEHGWNIVCFFLAALGLTALIVNYRKAIEIEEYRERTR
ncbi:MAG: hypothetical protein OEY22_03285 [Candidatus Bathyarchaeota archaeon]|nr:hypothetical protein [Candidatus Bathyarchaeota archaeon]MDH5786935.1 hypothetical protein [Candidatus Bathyarchaeota archaeon]